MFAEDSYGIPKIETIQDRAYRENAQKRKDDRMDFEFFCAIVIQNDLNRDEQSYQDWIGCVDLI